MIRIFVFLVFLVGCQTVHRPAPSRPVNPTPAVVPVPTHSAGSSAPVPTEPPIITSEPSVREIPEPVESHPIPLRAERPRLAVILGAGGLRAYAHAGFLQELAKAKIPIYSIAGLETGALPASLFAIKGQPFDPEWQMMKLKEDDWIQKSLLSGASAKKVGDFSGPLNLMYGATKAEDAKIPFICPTYSLAKRQVLMMTKGPFAQVLMYCLPALPLFEDYQGNGADPVALSQISQALRQKGAQLIVYVDLLSENSLSVKESGLTWGIYQAVLQESSTQVHEVVKVSGLGGFLAFGQRREMLQRGQEAGRKFIQVLQTKYGF